LNNYIKLKGAQNIKYVHTLQISIQNLLECFGVYSRRRKGLVSDE